MPPLLDQQLLFPHHHPNDHACQETLYNMLVQSMPNTEDSSMQHRVHSGGLDIA